MFIDIDWEFYVQRYPELGLKNEDQALSHWKNCGKKEGRCGIRDGVKILCTAIGIGDLLIIKKYSLTHNFNYDKIILYSKYLHYKVHAKEYGHFALTFAKKLFGKTKVVFSDKYDPVNIVEIHATSKVFNLYNIYRFNHREYFNNFIFSKPYIIFHTKYRFPPANLKPFLELFPLLDTFFSSFKTEYNIILFGEREVEDNYETRLLKIRTVYEIFSKMKENNHVIDLTTNNVGSGNKIDFFENDLHIINRAELNVTFGHGGPYCISKAFSDKTLCYIGCITEYMPPHYAKESVRDINVFFNQLKTYEKEKEKEKIQIEDNQLTGPVSLQGQIQTGDNQTMENKSVPFNSLQGQIQTGDNQTMENKSVPFNFLQEKEKKGVSLEYNQMMVISNKSVSSEFLQRKLNSIVTEEKIVDDKLVCRTITEHTINYVNSGALGDLIFLLYVIKMNYILYGKKGNLYLNDKKYFTLNFNQTYKELYPFILSQEYINDFAIYDKNIHVMGVDLDNWRNSPTLKNMNLLKTISSVYLVPYKLESWIHVSCNEKYKDKIIIHKGRNRNSGQFPWEIITKKNKCTFLTYEQDMYENFAYKDDVELLKAESLEDMLEVVRSCKYVITNQTSVLVMCLSMNKPCLAELFDGSEYQVLGLEENQNFSWIHKNCRHINKSLEDHGIIIS
jgi:hypothetical protein